jgi:hypothetical protein
MCSNSLRSTLSSPLPPLVRPRFAHAELPAIGVNGANETVT